MEHIGIDRGSKASQLGVRSTGGEIVAECRWRTDRLVVVLPVDPPLE